MSYKKEIEEFVIKGFKKINTIQYEKISENEFLLKNKKENFISIPYKGFDYHRWAGSFKSSQAFAYNVFSGVKNKKEFEFCMKVFDRPAQIDVMIENTETNTIELFEVKMLEIINLSSKKIEFKQSYTSIDEYKYCDINIAENFKAFLNKVINHFEKKEQRIYASGIKQLCSHLLGILNTMNEPNYKNNKFKLYSFCFDNPFVPKFNEDIENYKTILIEFKMLVDEFLTDIGLDSRIEYYGFLSATEYIEKNKTFLGKENYEYVMNRYFYNFQV